MSANNKNRPAPTAEKTPTGRRFATENALLDAFESVLVEYGIRRLSVNSIVASAGVGKPLLYRYFGNLAGLVRAWGVRRGFCRAVVAPPEIDVAAVSDDDRFRIRIADELVAGANALMRNPVMLELLAEELTANSELTEAFGQARGEHGRQFIREMLNDHRYVQPENRGLIIVLYAAITYLAMRARRAPHFMGLRLDTERGWDEAMRMVRTIALRPVEQAP